MKRIILDTNFLLIPFQFNVDIFSEMDRVCRFNYELCVLDRTIDELNNIVNQQKGKHKDAAMLGLFLAEHFKLKKLKTKMTKGKNVDDLLVDEAEKDKTNTIIATQDADLKRRLKKKGVKRIILRQKKYLELV